MYVTFLAIALRGLVRSRGQGPPRRAARIRPWPLKRRRRSNTAPLADARLAVAVVCVFLYAPLITLMAFSFNDTRRNIVWQGFTLRYYDKALQDNDLLPPSSIR